MWINKFVNLILRRKTVFVVIFIATAIVAVGVAMLVTQSEVIKEIMLILLIGLLADIINTWIQNVGLLRIYLERKERKKSHYSSQQK